MAICRTASGKTGSSTALSEQEQGAVRALIGTCDDGPNWGLIRLAQSSPAAFSIVPLQDVLGLGSDARLNTPSTTVGNYHWRYAQGALKPELAEKLAALAEVTDRLPQEHSRVASEDFFA
jgi:4-alpha-glucanotransferase